LARCPPTGVPGAAAAPKASALVDKPPAAAVMVPPMKPRRDTPTCGFLMNDPPFADRPLLSNPLLRRRCRRRREHGPEHIHRLAQFVHRPDGDARVRLLHRREAARD